MKRAVAAMLAALLLACAGCDKLLPGATSPFQGVDIAGSSIGGELRLADVEGHARSLGDFRGRLVLVIFGYTSCPDVCPTSLATAAEAMRALGDEASQVQVIFVTVDPKRDTAAVLKPYVAAFDPRFVALTGDEAAVKKAAQDFKVYASARDETAPGIYTVDHSGQMFVMDRAGKARLMLPPGIAPAAMAADLRVLLRS